jgi:preprotein translocase subunit SecY
MWWEKLKQAFKVPEVRNGLLFLGGMLVLFRLAANIPLPGIDIVALQRFFDANQALGLLNVFSGGTVRNFSIVALGVAPYITSSIIFQLLGMVIPRLEELQKEGEAGRQRINQWTRLLTVPLAIIQAFGLTALLRSSGMSILTNTSPLYLVALFSTVTAGTVFLMWLGELISEKKVGNGVSLLIAAGILADLPTHISRFLATYTSDQWFSVVLYAAIALITVAGVVFVSEGQRNIPVQYARQNQAATMGGVGSSLPLRVNMTGVIPIIFAMSLLLFPTMIAQFFASAKSAWLSGAASWVIRVLQDRPTYAVLYFLLVVGFTYFYTAVVFQPDKMAENLQKQGGFIPGVRPGRHTAEYLEAIITRITLGGALFLGVIAVLPVAAEIVTKSNVLALRLNLLYRFNNH